MTQQTPRLKASAIAAFAGPCLPVAALGLPLTVHLPAYYARDLGLPLAAVGMAFLLVRVLDILVDPLVGLAIDRTRSRLGRFRPWLMASGLMLSLGAWMLFMAKPGVSIGHLWVWLPVAFLGFSIATLTHQAWASVLSRDYDERSRIYGWWQAGNVAGLILVLLIATLAGGRAQGWSGPGIRAMGWLILPLAPATIALAVWRVGEPSPDAGHRRPGLVDYLRLLRMASVRRLMLVDLLLSSAAGVSGALAIFYYERVKGVPAHVINPLLLVYFAAAFAGAPLWPGLAKRIGKHRALSVTFLAMMAGFIAVLVVPFSNFSLAALVMAAMGLPYSGGAILLRSMLADCGDEFSLAARVESQGMLYALLTETTKVGYALGTAALVLLAALGFDPKAAHSDPTSLLELKALFVGLPSFFALTAAILILGYRLDAKRHSEIRAALAGR